ncbi:MAG: inner membrane-spanning protein YciB [Pseudomonadota bacterium]
MQMIIDFVPLLLALAAYKTYDIYAATIVLMVTLPLYPIYQKLSGKPVSKMHAWSAVLMLAFGTLTLTLRNPLFLMWKPTILYLAAAATFFVIPKLGQTPLVERMLGSAIELQPAQWRTLNAMWAGFFVFLALVNIAVAYSVEEAVWFQFKVWGLTGLLLVFVVVQSIWIGTHATDSDAGTNSEN